MPAFPASPMPSVPQPFSGKCMTRDCNRQEAPALKTGLCMKCHSAAKKLIDAGKTTWQQLEQMGLAKAPDSDDPFTKAFNEKQGR